MRMPSTYKNICTSLNIYSLFIDKTLSKILFSQVILISKHVYE